MRGQAIPFWELYSLKCDSYYHRIQHGVFVWCILVVTGRWSWHIIMVVIFIITYMSLPASRLGLNMNVNMKPILPSLFGISQPMSMWSLGTHNQNIGNRFAFPGPPPSHELGTCGSCYSTVIQHRRLYTQGEAFRSGLQ